MARAVNIKSWRSLRGNAWRYRSALILLLLLNPPITPAQVPSNFRGDFQSELRVGVGSGAFGHAIDDLNNDGRKDLVVAESADNAVGVLLGNGDGTFAAETTFAAGNYPAAVAIGDVNNDGTLDVVSANLNVLNLTNGGTVSVLIGNGDGTLAAAVNYAVGNNPASVVLADFNDDGSLDIASTDIQSGNIAVLLNNGDGTFQPAIQYSSGANAYAMGTADLNGDGEADLVVSNACGFVNVQCIDHGTTVAVLLGNGDGTFAAPVPYQTGKTPLTLVIVDLNGDNKPDVVTADFDGATASVLLGNGDGTLQVATSYPTGPMPRSLAAADFDLDGVPDLVVVTVNSDAPLVNGITELLGRGDGTFYAGVNYFLGTEIGVGGVAGDLDGDGRPDIVSDGSAGVNAVFLNAGGMTRQPTSVTLVSSSNPAQALTGLFFTATVNSTGPSPTGSVTFYVDGQAQLGLNIGILDGSNQVVTGLPFLKTGSHTMVAIYSGDTATQGSTSNAMVQTITAAPTSTTLTSDLNPSQSGQTVTFTAMVNAFYNDQGNVDNQVSVGPATFLDGSTVLGTAPFFVDSHGFFSVATLAVSTLSTGTHSITVEYGGNSFYASSVSVALQQIVNPNLNLGLAPGGQSSLTVSAGATANYMLVIGGAGFSGQTSMGCTGAPMGTSCTVTPASLTVSASSKTNLSVSVTTTARNSASLYRQDSGSAWLWAIAVFGSILLPVAGVKTNSGKRLSTTLTVWALLLLCSCGGGGGSGNNGDALGTPVGTYALTVTATSGSTVQGLPLTLVVQ